MRQTDPISRAPDPSCDPLLGRRRLRRVIKPPFLFLLLIALLVLFSAFGSLAGWSAPDPGTGASVRVRSLLEPSLLIELLVHMPANFARYPPVGVVLLVTAGVAVAERSGFFRAIASISCRAMSQQFLTPSIFVVALALHSVGDSAIVILVPLAATLYAQAGRHPLAGIAVAYAGVSGALVANLFPTPLDALLLGIAEPAARLIEPVFEINPAGNWWFGLTAGALFLPLAWVVVDQVVEPKLATHSVSREALAGARLLQPATAEKKGLLWAAAAACAVAAAWTLLLSAHDPFFQQRLLSLAAMLMLLFLAAGVAFGLAAGSVHSVRQVFGMIVAGLAALASWLLVAFLAAQVISILAMSNLGVVIGLNGATALSSLDTPLPFVLVLLLLITAGLDLLMPSASAKWAAMAPLAVPVLLALGSSPEMTVAGYRMGDSVVNVVTPVSTSFVLVLGFCQRWCPEFGIGSLIRMMLPFSVVFGLAGTMLVFGWCALELPPGPGSAAVQ